MNLKRSRSDFFDSLFIKKIFSTKHQKSIFYNFVFIVKAFTRDDIIFYTFIKRFQQRQRFTIIFTFAKQTKYIVEDFHE